MRFAQPEYFWFLFFLPVLVGLYFYAWARKKKLSARFASIPMMQKIAAPASPGRRLFRMGIMLLVVALLITALARPQWGRKMELVERKGLDIVLLQDVSLSMLAQDVKPSRLVRSRHEISDFLSRLTGDRVALVAFAGEAQTLCPLTLDYSAARIFLNELSPDWLMPGTDIAAAMEEGMKAFERGKSARKYQIMVLLTDGEEHDQRAVEVAQKAADAGITVYTVGIGSREGVPIPLPGQNGTERYKKDQRGNLVTTRLDEKTLKRVALTGGGKYFYANPGDFELKKILGDIMDRERRELKGERVEQYQDRFQIPLVLAVLLLILDTLLGDRRWRKKVYTGRRSFAAFPTAFFLFTVLGLLATASPVQAYNAIDEGNKAFAAKDYSQALQHYREAQKKSPDDEMLHYNTGTALYKTGKFEEAEKELKAAILSTDSTLARNAMFNLASVYYRMGTAQNEPTQKIARYKEAIAVLKRSLDYDPEYLNAKKNIEIIQQKLREEIDKQKQQQDQQNQQEQEQPEMSAKAKEALARALQLAKQRLYQDAMAVLNNVLETDETAQPLKSYVQRLQDVMDIAEGKKPAAEIDHSNLDNETGVI